MSGLKSIEICHTLSEFVLAFETFHIYRLETREGWLDNYPRPCYLNSYENFSRLGSELEGGRGPEDNMLMRQRGSGLYLINGVHEGHGERIDICSMYPASRTCARLPEAH